jgi:hypothetical protein
MNLNLDCVLLPSLRTNILAKFVMNTVLKERQKRRDGCFVWVMVRMVRMVR